MSNRGERNMKNLLKCATALSLLSGTVFGITIDFGTTWPVGFTAPNTGAYASDPLNRLLKNSNEKDGPEADIANFINSAAGTSFTASDIHKTDQPPEEGT